MSQIVYTHKGLALASGLAWSLRSSGRGLRKTRQAIREAALAQKATRYASTTHNGDTYLGMYRPDVLQRSVKGDVHSLALVFLNALLAENSAVDRSMLNAALSMGVESTDHAKRALVVIADGHVISDTVEPASRAVEIIEERRQQLGETLLVFTGDGDIPGAIPTTWVDLIRYASKSSQTHQVPTSLVLPGALLLALVALGGYAAYHYTVAIPAMEAERARKAAAADRTGQYLKQLAASMEAVGWSKDSLVGELTARKSDPFYTSGWALKSVSCTTESQRCTEQWERVGGKLPELVTARESYSYVPQQAAKDSEAVFDRVLAATSGRLTHDHIPVDAADADLKLRPVVNELVNAGARVQISEAVAWPPVPMQGVKPDAVIKRRKVSIIADYPLYEQVIDRLPAHVVPTAFTLQTSSPFELTLTAYAYVK
jgi:hypothetical protein